MKRLWLWLRGYTVEEWVSDRYRDALVVYRGARPPERISNDDRWHHLVMTCVRGKRRFYFDGRPWPNETR